MKYNAIDVLKPNLYKEILPYDELPKMIFNNIQLSTGEFKTYINMLYDFYNLSEKEEKLELEFVAKNSKDKIVITSLRDDYVKVCSVKKSLDEEKRVSIMCHGN